MKARLDAAGIVHQDQALRQAAGQAFYNTSPFTLRDLRGRASQQQLRSDFEAYLAGFSPNVQEILENFEFRNKVPRLSRADALGTLIEKLLDRSINLSPAPVLNADGSVRLPGLDNHAVGTIFEERVHRGRVEPDPLRGRYQATVDGGCCLVEYKPDGELGDSEQVSQLEPGGIEAFIRREVLPHAPDAWLDESSIRIGYEISFTRYVYKPQPLRSLAEIRADILAVERETEGLLAEIVGATGSAS